MSKMGVFADRRARWVVPVLLVLSVMLVGLWVGLQSVRPQGLHPCLVTSGACQDREVTVVLWTISSVPDADGFEVQLKNSRMRVDAEPADLRMGDVVTMGGTFLGVERRLRADWVKTHPMRQRKVVLGGLGVLFVMCMSVLWFRPRKWGVTLNG